jgi:hypothetical protein
MDTSVNVGVPLGRNAGAAEVNDMVTGDGMASVSAEWGSADAEVTGSVDWGVVGTGGRAHPIRRKQITVKVATKPIGMFLIAFSPHYGHLA